MGKIIDQHFMELLRTLTLHMNLSLKTGNMGSKRSKAIGSSVEFSDYREYMPGDDFRRIDWNAYARFEKVFIKLFMQEMETLVSVFTDTSASMALMDKRETAVKIAATFGYAALADYDSVTNVLFNDGIKDFQPPMRGTKSFNRIITQLEEASFDGESNLYKTVYDWQPKLKKGISVIVSDLMYDHELEKVLRLLMYRKQRVVLCHVLAKEELNPELEENAMLIDSETGEKMDIETGISAINLYKKRLRDYCQEIEATCSKYGVHYILVSTDEPIEKFISKLGSIS